MPRAQTRNIGIEQLASWFSIRAERQDLRDRGREGSRVHVWYVPRINGQAFQIGTPPALVPRIDDKTCQPFADRRKVAAICFVVLEGLRNVLYLKGGSKVTESTRIAERVGKETEEDNQSGETPSHARQQSSNRSERRSEKNAHGATRPAQSPEAHSESDARFVENADRQARDGLPEAAARSVADSDRKSGTVFPEECEGW